MQWGGASKQITGEITSRVKYVTTEVIKLKQFYISESSSLGIFIVDSKPGKEASSNKQKEKSSYIIFCPKEF